MTMKCRDKQYDTVAVFSGGGTRLAIYCGMYAALEDAGHTPDLIIGTCGGAVATGIINSFATNIDRRKYLESEELYEFIRATRLTDERKLSNIGILCLRKVWNRKNAPYIEDVFGRYLVDMPEDVSGLLPSLASAPGKHVRSVIVGAKVLFDKAETGSKRPTDRKLYRKVLFTDAQTAKNIDPESIRVQSANYRSSSVDSAVEVMTEVPMHTAMRISLSDMFYVAPVSYRGSCFSGGAIDLVPVELAKALGRHVILEKKNAYSAVEEALVRAVLGYSGNARLKDVKAQGAARWIDTRDATKVLRGYYCRKSIDLPRLQVSISLPQSRGRYVKDVDALWNYGYECVTKAFTE